MCTHICADPKAAATNHLTEASFLHLIRACSATLANRHTHKKYFWVRSLTSRTTHDTRHCMCVCVSVCSCSLSVLQIRSASFRIHDELDFTTAPAINTATRTRKPTHRHSERDLDTVPDTDMNMDTHTHTQTQTNRDADTASAAGNADAAAVHRDVWVLSVCGRVFADVCACLHIVVVVSHTPPHTHSHSHSRSKRLCQIWQLTQAPKAALQLDYWSQKFILYFRSMGDFPKKA